MLKSTRSSPTLLILLTIAAAVATAQTGTSRITGVALDSKGSIVPDATVTVMNEATGLLQTQATNDAGIYSFPSLPAGDYTVTVEKTGFKKFQKTNNALQVTRRSPWTRLWRWAR